MAEAIAICGCEIAEITREADRLILRLVCPVQEETSEAGGAEAAGEGEAHEQRTRLLRQAAEPLPAGEVLLNR